METSNTSVLTVEMNPNLELFAVIYILAFNGSDPFIMVPPDYIRDVLTYFGPYRNSEIVRYVQGVFNSSLPFYTRDDAMMALSTRLAKLNYLGNITNDTALGLDLGLFSEFARESNFEAFYRAHLKDYERPISNLSKILSRAPQWYWRLFGKRYTRFRVEASYSLRIHPHSVGENGTVYYIGFIPRDMDPSKAYGLALVVLHEFAHPFVEDFLKENFQLFKNMSYYLNEIRSELPFTTSYDLEHYGTFYNYLNELFTESMAEYIGLKCGIPEDYVTLQRLSMSVPLFPLSKFFEEYGHMEKSGMKVSEYAPIFARHMAEWATPENVSALYWEVTPVTWVHERDSILSNGKVVIVYGTSGSEKALAEFLEQIPQRGYLQGYGQAPSIVLKEVDELTPDDMKANLILIGTPETNELVERLNDRLPVKFLFNGSWTLRRSNDSVGMFFAFKITNESVISLLLNAPVPSQWGLIETIKNPWGNNTYITVIAGRDKSLIMQALQKTGYESYTLVGKKYLEIGFYMETGGVNTQNT
ncbi:DUF4932 domain-containing protein [Thermococcus sp.]